jgi:hypothetical protein
VTVGAHQRLCADTPASAPEAPGRALGRQRSSGPMATHAMHSCAGGRGGACDVQAADGCPTAKQLGRRSEAELLVELEAPSCEIPTREARVLEPQLGRRAHGAGEDQLAKAGGEGRSAPRSGPRLRRWAGRGAAGRACRRTGCACRWARVRGRARCADPPPSSAWPGRARRALSAPASGCRPGAAPRWPPLLDLREMGATVPTTSCECAPAAATTWSTCAPRTGPATAAAADRSSDHRLRPPRGPEGRAARRPCTTC